jgi:hypothetical protein
MDLDALLNDLRARLQVIVQAIAELEEIQGSTTASTYFRKRSGRKSMGAEERPGFRTDEEVLGGPQK